MSKLMLGGAERMQVDGIGLAGWLHGTLGKRQRRRGIAQLRRVGGDERPGVFVERVTR